MPISWMSALKAVPWADVIEATPALVKGARRLFKRSQGEAAEAAAPPGALPQTLPEALQRLQALEQELAELAQAQAESAALLQSLAEQNAHLVAALEALRQRSRLLGLGLAAVAALSVALLAWALQR